MSSVATLKTLAVLGAGHRHWYTAGLPALHAAADVLGVSVDVLADVVALTSPRVQVRRNMVLAVRYLQDREHWRTRDTPELARELGVIRSTAAALRHWEATGRIRGPKTRAFARALQGDPTALVLDVWMARALGVAQAKVNQKLPAAKAAQRVGKVARDLGWTVAETQAAIWAGTIPTHRNAAGRRQYQEAPGLGELLLDALP